jgi:hypothetical protein
MSSAKLRALSSATMAAAHIERMSAEPACAAAMPVTTKMPAPMIAPTPTAVASIRPSVGRSLWLIATGATGVVS